MKYGGNPTVLGLMSFPKLVFRADSVPRQINF